MPLVLVIHFKPQIREIIPHALLPNPSPIFMPKNNVTEKFFSPKGISSIYIANQDASHILSKVKSATKHTFALQSPLALIG